MLAIASGKGGCGKTTTAVGLARALAHDGHAPLVADADHEMPDLHFVADVPRTPGLPALADGDRPATVARTPVGDRDLAVVPTAGISAERVPAALDRLGQWDGPVLIDCPAGVARDAARPLRAADETLLVTSPDPQTLRDTAKTAAMARTLGAAPVGVVVIDRSVERPTDGVRLSQPTARSLLGCPVIARVPAVSDRPLGTDRVRTAYRKAARKLFKRNI
ncbi:P-loop NTPase [Halorientalis brevis]|uniref:P-loop NTPase n=1 Tax=Halorientalis brevis TaxID=1126241 RepID=A0ABD6CFL0_9EURY|nr:P-loop NTPase [Halorientalis brevis]